MKDERLFFEALAGVSTRDFFVLGAGLLTMRLWLPADRLLRLMHSQGDSVDRL